jgi:hypothetical protein
MVEEMTIAELTATRDAVRVRLEQRWAWCAANPTHPQHAAREVDTLLDLRAYERAEDALTEALAWQQIG